MVFSMNTVKSVQSKSFPIKEKRIINIDHISLFLESLKLIQENNRNIESIFNSIPIQELSFSKSIKSALFHIDYKKIFQGILSGFMKMLDNLWNHFHALLLNLLGENNVIKSNKEKLQNFNISIKYNEDRFIYTNLGTSTSYTSFKSELEKEFSSLILGLGKITHISSNSAAQAIEELREKFKITEEYENELRGRIVGSKNSIEKEQFASVLYNYFRNNGYKISEGSNIQPEEIRKITSEYFDNKNNIKEVEKDKKDLMKASKDIQKQIMNVKLEDYLTYKFPQDVTIIFNSVLDNQCRRVKILCDLYIQVFSAKLDAVKESYSQYRRILFKACQELARRGL